MKSHSSPADADGGQQSASFADLVLDGPVERGAHLFEFCSEQAIPPGRVYRGRRLGARTEAKTLCKYSKMPSRYRIPFSRLRHLFGVCARRFQKPVTLLAVTRFTTTSNDLFTSDWRVSTISNSWILLSLPIATAPSTVKPFAKTATAEVACVPALQVIYSSSLSLPTGSVDGVAHRAGRPRAGESVRPASGELLGSENLRARAASSIARGIPSTRRQMSVMMSSFSAVSVKPSSIAAARSAKSVTAASEASDGIRNVASPGISRGCREEARIESCGHSRRSSRHRRDAGDEVLAVIENQECLQALQRPSEERKRVALADELNAHRGGHRGCNVFGIY